MRITLEIPDDMVEAIDEEITMNSHNECGDGPLPAEGAWAIFQGLWGDALEDARAAPNAPGKPTAANELNEGENA